MVVYRYRDCTRSLPSTFFSLSCFLSFPLSLHNSHQFISASEIHLIFHLFFSVILFLFIFPSFFFIPPIFLYFFLPFIPLFFFFCPVTFHGIPPNSCSAALLSFLSSHFLSDTPTLSFSLLSTNNLSLPNARLLFFSPFLLFFFSLVSTFILLSILPCAAVCCWASSPRQTVSCLPLALSNPLLSLIHHSIIIIFISFPHRNCFDLRG